MVCEKTLRGRCTFVVHHVPSSDTPLIPRARRPPLQHPAELFDAPEPVLLVGQSHAGCPAGRAALGRLQRVKVVQPLSRRVAGVDREGAGPGGEERAAEAEERAE